MPSASKLQRQNTGAAVNALKSSGIDIDESGDVAVAEQAAPPPSHAPCTRRRQAPLVVQLRRALVANMVRVVDLFKEWDANGDGTVSKAEFQRALPMLGLNAPRDEVGKLFDSWDPDRSGSLEIAELTKILKRGGTGEADVAFSKPRLDNIRLAANATPQQKREHQQHLLEETEQARRRGLPLGCRRTPHACAALARGHLPSLARATQLENDQAERSNCRLMLQQLQAEMVEMRKMREKMDATVSQESKVKQALEKQAARPGKNDPAVVGNTLEETRRRNKMLQKVRPHFPALGAPAARPASIVILPLPRVRVAGSTRPSLLPPPTQVRNQGDSSQLPKEQNKYFHGKDECAKLQQECKALQLEITQMDRKLESNSKMYEKNRFEKYGITPPELNEASRKNFQAKEKRARDACAATAAKASAVKGDWERWLQVLMQCSNTLQGRADAVNVNQLSDLYSADNSTPGEAVLEMIRRKESRRAALQKRALDVAKKEDVLKAELMKIRKKIDLQTTLLAESGHSPGKEKGGADGFFEL